MRWLLFLGRLVCICNLFFIACMAFRYFDVVENQGLRSFIIIMGWLLAPILNILFNVLYITLAYLKKLPSGMPRWLIIFNMLMLLAQLIIILFL